MFHLQYDYDPMLDHNLKKGEYFYQLGVEGRVRETQLQLGENLNEIT